jgi:hypothetical protein
MPRQRYDPASKWLLHHQGRGVLLVGGLTNVRRYQPMPGEIVQNRNYPDGLLQVFLGHETKPHHVLIEVATYPEKRALKQALNDLTLAYNMLGHLPDLLMFVLRPKGKYRISGQHEIHGKLGLARLTASWTVKELWTLSAEEHLTSGDVSVVPWTVLMQFAGPPEALLERCADKIEREAHPKDRADLLAVTQVLAELVLPIPAVLDLFKGKESMIESPLLQRMRAETLQDAILDLLKDRFGSVPQTVRTQLQAVLEEKRLKKLIIVGAKCRDLDAFREALPT